MMIATAVWQSPDSTPARAFGFGSNQEFKHQDFHLRIRRVLPPRPGGVPPGKRGECLCIEFSSPENPFEVLNEAASPG